MRKLFCILIYFFTANVNAQNWQSIDTFSVGACTAAYYDSTTNSLFVGGQYVRIEGTDTIYGIGQYKDGQWIQMGAGVDWMNGQPFCSSCIPNPVNSIIRFQDTIYITGSFLYSNNTYLNGIAKWDGSSWKPIGRGLRDSFGSPALGYKFKIYNNELYLSGAFDSINGVVAHSLAKYDGVQWSAINNLPIIYPNNPNFIYDFEFFNGELYVGGIMDNNTSIKDIMKWDGSAWVNPGIGMYGLGYIRGITVFQNELYVIGSYSYYDHPLCPGNCIVKYNGTSWSSVGTGMVFSPNSIAWINAYKIQNNVMYLGGSFDDCNGSRIYSIAKYDGTQFCSLDTTTYFNIGVDAIEFMNDTLYVGGYLNSSIHTLARCVDYTYSDLCSASVISIREEESNSDISIYPNPANKEIIIKLKNDDYKGLRKLLVYNLAGQEIYRFSFSSNTIELPVSDLPTGMYFVKMEYSDKFITTKFIKN